MQPSVSRSRTSAQEEPVIEPQFCNYWTTPSIFWVTDANIMTSKYIYLQYLKLASNLVSTMCTHEENYHNNTQVVIHRTYQWLWTHAYDWPRKPVKRRQKQLNLMKLRTIIVHPIETDTNLISCVCLVCLPSSLISKRLSEGLQPDSTTLVFFSLLPFLHCDKLLLN